MTTDASFEALACLWLVVLCSAFVVIYAFQTHKHPTPRKWIRVYDDNSHSYYYYDEVTGESTWDFLATLEC